MIGIISCGKAKRKTAQRAAELYTGSLFKAQLKYARHYASPLYILSAKFGLVPESRLLPPYEQSASALDRAAFRAWCELVAGQLATLPPGPILALVSARYELVLAPRAQDLQNPLRGLPLGKRLQYLSAQTRSF